MSLNGLNRHSLAPCSISRWRTEHICISRNEDDRNRLSPSYQFLLKIRSGHSRHGHVKEQASGLANAIRREELLGRRERAGSKTELLQ